MNIGVDNHLFPSDAAVRELVQGQISLRRTDGSYFQRLAVVWNETQRGENGQVNAIRHLFTIGIDSKNQCYIDCRKRLIFLKIVASTVFRPIVACMITAYSLSMIPIFKAIFEACSGKITREEAWQRSVRSIKDIARVPLYELAMVIVGCVGVLVAPFAPTTLYRFRELIGKIERAMCYGEYRGSYAFTPCFQSRQLSELIFEFTAFEFEGRHCITNKSNTDYGEHSLEAISNLLGIEDYLSLFEVANEGQLLRMRSNFNEAFERLSPEKKIALQRSLAYRGAVHYARSMISSLRQKDAFGGELLGAHAAYISPAASQLVTQPQTLIATQTSPENV